jgi:hypothetical protein
VAGERRGRREGSRFVPARERVDGWGSAGRVEIADASIGLRRASPSSHPRSGFRVRGTRGRVPRGTPRRRPSLRRAGAPGELGVRLAVAQNAVAHESERARRCQSRERGALRRAAQYRRHRECYCQRDGSSRRRHERASLRRRMGTGRATIVTCERRRAAFEHRRCAATANSPAKTAARPRLRMQAVPHRAGTSRLRRCPWRSRPSFEGLVRAVCC